MRYPKSLGHEAVKAWIHRYTYYDVYFRLANALHCKPRPCRRDLLVNTEVSHLLRNHTTLGYTGFSMNETSLLHWDP